MRIPAVAVACCLLLQLTEYVSTAGDAFTYQGVLTEGGSIASGTFDLQFALYDAETGGTPVGMVITNASVAVVEGLFSTHLNFGPVFTGAAYWLEIGIRTNRSDGQFTLLHPRQLLTPAPYALHALAAGVADSANSVIEGSISVQQLSTPAPASTNEVLVYDGGNLVWTNAAEVAGAWTLGGNANTDPSRDFLGTANGQALEFRVNNERTLRLEPTTAGPNVIIGHASNYIDSNALGSVIGGGGSASVSNATFASYTVIGGGEGNLVFPGAVAAQIAGGSHNSVGESAVCATIGGGAWNGIQPQTFYAVVSGGTSNTIQVNAEAAFIGAGANNVVGVGAGWSAIPAGVGNAVSMPLATICGGQSNSIAANTCTIGGGHLNAIQNRADNSIIGGGSFNTVRSSALASVVAGGTLNTAGGVFASVPGGLQNLAGGDYSFAGGRRAKAIHEGTFIWADSTDTDFSSSRINEFAVRATGGVRFDSGLTNGVALAPGSGSWSSLSDRDAKQDFAPVDSVDILERVVNMPVLNWRYRTERDAVRHIRPVSQDFYSQFNVGPDDKHIATVDADGVALAAIQGLNQKLEEAVRIKDAKIAALERRLEVLEQFVANSRAAAD